MTPILPAPTPQSAALLEESTRGLHAIAAEAGDYSRRLIEDGTSTFGQMAHARSMPEVLTALGAFNKRTGEEYMQHVTRLGAMYAEVARHQSQAMQAFMTQMPMFQFSLGGK